MEILILRFSYLALPALISVFSFYGRPISVKAINSKFTVNLNSFATSRENAAISARFPDIYSNYSFSVLA